MIRLILVTVLLLCSTAAHAQRCWYGAVGNDPGAVGNVGVRADFTFTSMGPLNGWIAQDMSNGAWAQVGIIEKPFYYAFQPDHVSKIGSSKFPLKGKDLAPGIVHTFEMIWTRGTMWSFYVDNKQLGALDMTAATGAGDLEMLAEGCSTDQSADMMFTNAAYLKNGTWTKYAHGQALIIDSTVYPQGVQGNLQGGFVPLQGVGIGRKYLPAPAPNTPLW